MCLQSSRRPLLSTDEDAVPPRSVRPCVITSLQNRSRTQSQILQLTSYSEISSSLSRSRIAFLSFKLAAFNLFISISISCDKTMSSTESRDASSLVLSADDNANRMSALARTVLNSSQNTQLCPTISTTPSHRSSSRTTYPISWMLERKPLSKPSGHSSNAGVPFPPDQAN